MKTRSSSKSRKDIKKNGSKGDYVGKGGKGTSSDGGKGASKSSESGKGGNTSYDEIEYVSGDEPSIPSETSTKSKSGKTTKNRGLRRIPAHLSDEDSS